MTNLAHKRIGILVAILCCCFSLGVRSEIELRTGYTLLTVDPGTPTPAGMALYTYTDSQGIIVSEAGVPATEPIFSGRIFVDQNSAETGVAIVNPNEHEASISLVLRDSAGNDVANKVIFLDPGNYLAKFVSEAWGLFPDLPAGLTGTLSFESSEAVAVMALRQNTNARNEPLYTTLPVVDLSQNPSSDPVVFPQIAAGGGYSTSIVLMNNGALTERGKVRLVGDDGNPLPMRMGDLEAAEFSYSIPPNGVDLLELEGPAETVAGYAIVTPVFGSTTPAGTAIFRIKENGSIVTEAGVGAAASTAAARIFVDNAGSDTGVALVNRQNVPADVALSLLTTEGEPVSSFILTIPPCGYAAKLASEMFFELAGEKDFTGLLEVSSPEPFSATALKVIRHSRVLTTLPVADLIHPPTAQLLVFPQVAIGGGFSTRIILVNPENAMEGRGSIRFYQSDGRPWNIMIGRTMDSRFAYNLTPRGGQQQTPASDAPIEKIVVLDPSSNLPAREIVVNEGNTLRPTLAVFDVTGAQREDFPVSFQSINPEVATVAGDGAITGNKAGSSTLTIESGGAVATTTVTVVSVTIGMGGSTGTGIVQDSARRLYLAATHDHTILLVEDIGAAPGIYAGMKNIGGLRNAPRLESMFKGPSFLSINNAQGALYVSDGANNVIRTVQPGPDGRVETLAGAGTRGSRDGPVQEAQFNNPQGACLDGRGNLWIVDSGNHAIRRINLVTGIVETIAGKPGTSGFSNGAGSAALFSSPVGIASETDSSNPSFLTPSQTPAPVSMIVADTGNGVLRRVSETGEVQTIGSTPAGDSSVAAALRFNSPTGVAVDPFGNIYVSETKAPAVKLLLKNRDVVSAAQAGTFASPAGLAVNQGGKVVVADSGSPAKEVVYGAPEIAGISPEGVSSKGGETVTVYGANFSPETIVALRGILVSGLRIENTQKLIFTAPAVAGGLNTLTVQNRGGIAQKALLIVPPTVAELPRGYITTVAGGGNNAGDGGLATEARVAFPAGLAIDSTGNVYFAEDRRVRKIDARTAIITTVIGTGEARDAGDGGPAILASIKQPYGVAVDARDNVFVSDQLSHRVRRLDIKTGIIDTIAGTGVAGGSGDNGPAKSAQLADPSAIAFDSGGNLFVAEGDNRVRRIDAATQGITTFTSVSQAISALALDKADNLYVTDFERVLRIDARTGIMTTVAGGGTRQTYLKPGESFPATSISFSPGRIAFDAAGNLYVTISAGIGRIDAKTGFIARFTGFGPPLEDIASAHELSGAGWITFDAAGNLLFTADTVRKVIAGTNTVSTIAGTGKLGFSGDQGPAIAAEIFTSTARTSNYARLALDRQNNLYVSDPWNRCIRRVDASSGIITTVYTAPDPDVPVYDAPVSVNGITLDSAGNLFVSDGSIVWRRLATTGIFSRIAGRLSPVPDPIGQFCERWDGKSALEAALGGDLPAMAFDSNGDLLISDRLYHRIRKIQMNSGILRTYAGTDSCLFGGFSGDGGPGTNARLNNPWEIVVDHAGNLLISDWQNHRIRKVEATTGLITTVLDFSQSIHFAKSFAIDLSGNIYLLSSNWSIVKFDPATTTLVDLTKPFFEEGESGDGIPASNARLIDPADIVFDPEGNLWIADPGSGRVRVIRGPL